MQQVCLITTVFLSFHKLLWSSCSRWPCIRYTHKTSSYWTSSYKTSSYRTSSYPDVKSPGRQTQVTGRPVIGCPDYRTSSLPNVQITNVQITILSLRVTVLRICKDQIILLGPDRHPKLLNHSLSVCLETASTYFFIHGDICTWVDTFVRKLVCSVLCKTEVACLLKGFFSWQPSLL